MGIGRYRGGRGVAAGSPEDADATRFLFFAVVGSARPSVVRPVGLLLRVERQPAPETVCCGEPEPFGSGSVPRHRPGWPGAGRSFNRDRLSRFEHRISWWEDEPRGPALFCPPPPPRLPRSGGTGRAARLLARAGVVRDPQKGTDFSYDDGDFTLPERRLALRI